MKPNMHSRLFWCGMASAFCSSLSASLAGTGAPAWVVAIVSSCAAAAAAGVLYLRSGDVREVSLRTIGSVADLQARAEKRQRGSVTVDGLTWAAAIVFAVLLLIVVTSSGCGSAWPNQCQVDVRSGVSCDCRPGGVVVTKYRTLGLVTIDCNGDRLPIDIEGEVK